MTVLVVAAIIVDGERVLTTRRPSGAHLAGMWEFPGGKVEPDEDPRDALVRELREELGVHTDAREVVDVTFHRYPTKSVLLMFFRTFLASSSPPPSPLGVDAIAWRRADELDDSLFPPADVAVLARVRGLLQG